MPLRWQLLVVQGAGIGLVAVVAAAEAGLVVESPHQVQTLPAPPPSEDHLPGI